MSFLMRRRCLFYNQQIGADTFNKYFAGLVEKYSAGGRFGFKINVDKFTNLTSIIDLESLLPRGSRTYFWMTRDDIISQAFSFARAKQSGHWHDYRTHSIGQPSASLPLTYNDIWREVLLILREEQAFLAFARQLGIAPIPLNYEQMVSDKRMIVLRVMTALKCDVEMAGEFLLKIEDKTKRLEPGEKYQFLIGFFDVHGDTITDLFRERHSPQAEEWLRKTLLARHNLRF